jgi:hypothetical protein
MSSFELKLNQTQEIALPAFLDLEGECNRTALGATVRAANQHGVEPTVCRWINFMLESRSMVHGSCTSGETLQEAATRGYLQGKLCHP